MSTLSRASDSEQLHTATGAMDLLKMQSKDVSASALIMKTGRMGLPSALTVLPIPPFDR